MLILISIKSCSLISCRKLTDKPKDEKLDTKDGTVIENPNDASTDPIVNVEEIGKGNNYILPVFYENESKEKLEMRQQTIANAVESAEGESNSTTSSSALVLHKGALIDVEKLLYQLKRSEAAREETEQRLLEATKSTQELTASMTKVKDKLKDLQSDLKSSNRKLSDTEQSLTSSNVIISSR